MHAGKSLPSASSSPTGKPGECACAGGEVSAVPRGRGAERAGAGAGSPLPGLRRRHIGGGSSRGAAGPAAVSLRLCRAASARSGAARRRQPPPRGGGRPGPRRDGVGDGGPGPGRRCRGGAQPGRAVSVRSEAKSGSGGASLGRRRVGPPAPRRLCAAGGSEALGRVRGNAAGAGAGPASETEAEAGVRTAHREFRRLSLSARLNGAPNWPHKEVALE